MRTFTIRPGEYRTYGEVAILAIEETTNQNTIEITENQILQNISDMENKRDNYVDMVNAEIAEQQELLVEVRRVNQQATLIS